MRVQLSYIILITLMVSCKPEIIPPPNPFDQYRETADSTGNIRIPEPDPQTIQGLHKNFFRTTCANSGCHDGSFEPDFRTIESTYNTLVFHPLIKNNPQGTLEYRVEPGKADRSALWIRLNEDIDGQSGIMPLVIDPDSDWGEKKSEHLQNLKVWIDNGARDMFGNTPVQGDIQPYIKGIAGFAEGSNAVLEREANNGPIQIPANASQVKIWFSLADDKLSPTQFSNIKVRISTVKNDFSNLTGLPVNIDGPIYHEDFYGKISPYHHYFNFQPSGFAAGSVLYIRVYIQDPSQPDLTEIPSFGSPDYMKESFAVKIF